jgi:outer membrane protein, heavy metal efflux system
LGVEQQKLLREEYWLRATLNELRGLGPEEKLESVIVNFSDDDSSSNYPSLDEQPEMAALKAQASQAAGEYRLAKLALYPDFVVQAMAMQPRGAMGDERSNWGLMVGINLPLFAARKQSNQLAAAQHEQHAVEMERLSLRNRLNSEIVNARQALLSARQMQSLYEDDVLPNTRAAVANAQTAYQARRMQLANYLSVSRALKTQELELVALRIDVELAKTRLRELLSSPPLMQFAPARPTLFDGAQMGGGMQASDAVSMGRGMTDAKATGRSTGNASDSGTSGMGGMK